MPSSVSEIDIYRARKELMRHCQTGCDTPNSHAQIGPRYFVIKHEGGAYYPSELLPNGVLCTGEEPNLHFDRSMQSSICEAYKRDPNAFDLFCSKANINTENLIRVGGGYSLGSIYYNSFDEAFNAILGAIKDNQILKHELSAEEMNSGKSEANLMQEEIDSLKSKISYFENKLVPTSKVKTLFADKFNMLGDSLSEESKKEIMSYINNPTLEAWRSIRSIAITPSKTIWQQLVSNDCTTPISGDGFNESNIPSSGKIIEVLTAATESHNNYCKRRIRQYTKELSKLMDDFEERFSGVRLLQ